MKTYTITIHKDFLTPLREAIALQGNNATFKVVREMPNQPKYCIECDVEITAKDDTVLFFIGFYLERQREFHQVRHYDLRDTNTVSVDIPDSFLLICKKVQILPARALQFFAGDASLHPFISNGSDERMMAKDYFLRAYALDREEEGEGIFEDLQILRDKWRGVEHQDAFKKVYRERLEELNDLIP